MKTLIIFLFLSYSVSAGQFDKRRQLVIKKAQARTTYNKPVRTVYTYYYIVPSYQQWFNYYNNRYYNHRHYYNGGY